MNNNNHYDAIVIGGGPAGLTAGIYLSRARHKTLIISDGVAGGQMILTHKVDNYPGVDSISGYQLATIMKKQASDFGCDIRTNVSIREISLEGDLKWIKLPDGKVYTSDAIILSPGGRSRTLGVSGEDRFKGMGISYCATCDGDFFTDREIVVVGGGNSVLEEAVSLTRYAKKVTIVHQFDHFQAFEHAIEEARQNTRIQFIMESVITGFYGNENLESVSMRNLKNGKTMNLKTDGVFIFIGYLPNTEFLRGKLDLNPSGEIPVKYDMSTGIRGVYAAGDSITKRFRQITTAVADGTVAALSAAEYLHTLKLKQKQFITA